MIGTPTHQSASAPACFGSEWDPKDVDCTGGYNPLYNAGKDGTKIQPRCDFFEPCKGRVSLKRIENLQRQGQLIKPEALIQARRLADQIPLTSSAPQAQPREQHTAQTPLAEVLQAQGQAMHPLLLQWLITGQPPQGVALGGSTTPQPRQRENVNPSPLVHPYLSVAEPRKRGGSLMPPLGREMVRAALKAVFQTGANFVDFNPLGEEDD